ncbi:MAG: FtsX-like permease family protein [Candidatus Kerfeldbacteria bacterium]|nr:FtsX-like permease family protein [Candidatus Kerfeldbacteria bacterium]
MFVGIIRTIRFAVQNFSRNLWLSVITVFLLVLTTMSMTLVGTLNIIGQQVIHTIQDKVSIDLYFYDSVSEKDIIDTQNFLQSLSGVADLVYVSKDQALEQFKEKHADDPEILSSLSEMEENVLPASLTVRARSIDDYPHIIRAFQASPYSEFIDRTDYSDNRAIINRVTTLTHKAYDIGLGVSLIFIIISIVVIFNTIRITIYSHREEVGIMKLVGATNWFVRAPFVLESVLLAVIASVITLSLFYVLLYGSDPTITAFFEGQFSILHYCTEHIWRIVAIEFGGAILLSVASSMIAITRYLKK